MPNARVCLWLATRRNAVRRAQVLRPPLRETAARRTQGRRPAPRETVVRRRRDQSGSPRQTGPRRPQWRPKTESRTRRPMRPNSDSWPGNACRWRHDLARPTSPIRAVLVSTHPLRSTRPMPPRHRGRRPIPVTTAGACLQHIVLRLNPWRSRAGPEPHHPRHPRGLSPGASDRGNRCRTPNPRQHSRIPRGRQSKPASA